MTLALTRPLPSRWQSSQYSGQWCIDKDAMGSIYAQLRGNLLDLVALQTETAEKLRKLIIELQPPCQKELPPQVSS